MHKRGVLVFGFCSSEASGVLQWVGDLDKSGKLIAPYWALQELGHGMARYSMGWVLNCTFARVVPSGQAGDVHLINNTSLPALLRP